MGCGGCLCFRRAGCLSIYACWLPALLFALARLLVGHTAQLLAEVGDGAAVLAAQIILGGGVSEPELRERGRDLRVVQADEQQAGAPLGERGSQM